MRYTHLIAFVLAFFVATSCHVDDIDTPTITNPTNCENIKIAASITRFDDCNVNTRANKTPDEAYVSSMALAVFPIYKENDKDVIGDCISYTHLKGSNLTFTLDRKDLSAEYYDKPFALYVFMNMPSLPATFGELTNKSLGWFKSQEYANNGIRRPQTGFPMVGSLGDIVSEDGDGTEFILIPTRKDADGNIIPAKDENGNILKDNEGNIIANKILLPLVGGTHKDYIPIPMKALYAKFSFEIVVDPNQSMVGGAVPEFAIEKYTVHNIAKSVHIDKTKNGEATVDAANNIVATMTGAAKEGSSVKFDFYLPERFLTPATDAEQYRYPLGKNSTIVTGYSNVRPEDQKYCQRFKGKLLGDTQLGTYITLHGKYQSHQEDLVYDVEYNIYLGADNYGDFNVKRNTNYINKVTIRGITASDDQSLNEDGIFIDHRVHIERALPIIINLQRETQLDSHFEVRPLRVRYPFEGDIPEGASFTAEILPQNNGDDVSWVRMEHNNGGTADNTYCANGKRRYFTTDLVTTTLKENGTSNGHKVGSRIETKFTSNKNETIWIYIDQCDEQAPVNNPNETRRAVLRISYNDGKGNTGSVDYVLEQYKLYPVTTTRTASDVAGTGVATGSYTYYIEHEEEYLNNYDSEDDYGLTEDGGMEWGLNGIQLSHLDDAISVKANDSGWDFIATFFGWNKQQIVDNAVKKIDPYPYYDYYLVRDITEDEESLIEPYAFNGLKFNTDIISYLISTQPEHQTDGNEDTKVCKVNKIALDEMPKSAIAYCYNKNKRTKDGLVENIEWYLPAIDEIEDIAENAYGDFETQFQGNLYWSSQSSYYRYDTTWTLSSLLGGNQTLPGIYYTDNTYRARATKALKTAVDNKYHGADSGDMQYATQTGSIYAPLWGSPTINMDPFVLNPNYKDQCPDYEGNLPRTGKKARVRCVRYIEN